MVPPRLIHGRLAVAAVGVLATTLLGGVVAVLDPGTAGGTAPHPVLAGTPGEAASILATNTATLAIPYLLCVPGMAGHPVGRRIGDLAVAALTCQNTMPIGIALTHWRAQLLPYIPQLPVEGAALTTAVAAWIAGREGQVTRRSLTGLATGTLVLLVVAAALETWGTPHRDAPRWARGTPAVDTARDPNSRAGDGGCGRPGLCTDDGRVAARSRAPFPSPDSVPLGRLTGADRAPTTHRPPQGGIT
jgi:hypothetical protein